MPDPKTKGTHVLNAVKVLKANRERSLAALPPRLHHYLDDRILPSSWYPVEDHLGLLRAIAGQMPAAPDPWTIMGRGTAQMDLNGIYRNHLRPGDPERSLTAMSALWRSAHDNGVVTTALTAPKQVVIRLSGSELRSKEICRITNGYLSEVVALSGAVPLQVAHNSCHTDGAAECVWTVTWK